MVGDNWTKVMCNDDKIQTQNRVHTLDLTSRKIDTPQKENHYSTLQKPLLKCSRHTNTTI